MSGVTDADRRKAAQALADELTTGRDAIAAALAEERAKARAEVLAERGTCGDTLPAHTLAAGTGMAVCELPPGHSGWHQMTDDPSYPPMRWIASGGNE